MGKANCQNACSQKIYAKLLNNLLTNSHCKKGIYGSDQCENIGFLVQAGNNLKELAFTNLKISYPLAFPRKSTCDFSSRTWFSRVKISMFTRDDSISKRVGREDFCQVILLNRFFLMINGQKSVKPRISSSRHYFQIKFQNITLIHVFGKKIWKHVENFWIWWGLSFIP